MSLTGRLSVLLLVPIFYSLFFTGSFLFSPLFPEPENSVSLPLLRVVRTGFWLNLNYNPCKRKFSSSRSLSLSLSCLFVSFGGHTPGPPGGCAGASSILPSCRASRSFRLNISQSNNALLSVCVRTGVQYVDNTVTFQTQTGAPRQALYKDQKHPSHRGVISLAWNFRFAGKTTARLNEQDVPRHSPRHLNTKVVSPWHQSFQQKHSAGTTAALLWSSKKSCQTDRLPACSQSNVPLQTPSDGKQWFASRTTPPWNITLSLVIRERVTSKHPLVGNPRLPITLRQYYKWLRSFWSQFISLLNVAVCYFRVWASFLNCRCCSTAVKTGWVAIVRSLLFGPVF